MRHLSLCLTLLVFTSFATANDDVSIPDLISHHLASIGTESARTAAKTRMAQGTLHFRILNRGGEQDGKQVLISEGARLASLLKLPNPSYHGERFVSDGKSGMVANITPGTYSEFGQFVHIHDEILTEGLWGGVLSTAWAVEGIENRHAKLHYEGIKKVDGHEMCQVRYIPGRKSDLEIMLYFERDTFRHVMTTYSLTIRPQLARSDRLNSLQQPTYYHLEERFSDFKSVDGLQLPGRWVVQFAADVPRSPGSPNLAGAQSATSEFDATEINVSNNISLDPKNFEVK